MSSSARWLPVPHRPAYEVSDSGLVRHGPRLLAQATHSKGYRKLHLGRGHQCYVHVLVAAAFLGPRPVGFDVDHLDFDRAHNALGNLRYWPALLNAVRWKGRTGTTNLWQVDHDGVPEDDYTPMTDKENADVLAELEAAGW